MKKMMLISALIAALLFSCLEDEKEVEEIKLEPTEFTKEKITGATQKGPYLNGSSLMIFELDSNITQTGKTFHTQVNDNLGSFQFGNIRLQTRYVKFKADGFYFNEITNRNSAAPVSLYALSDISDKSTVNVNLISTLEVQRTEYLIEQGYTFKEAKKQAQEEVLKIFFVEKPNMSDSELLDITKSGDENAILLAATAILQGFRTEAELSQLLADISSDIRTDGVLSNPELGSLLVNDAVILNLPSIRNNLEKRYAASGIQVAIPDFEKYVVQFNEKNTYTFTNLIRYPLTGKYGQNLLSITDSVINIGFYSFSADIPRGMALKVRHNGGNGVFGYGMGTLDGWHDHGPDSITWRTYSSSRTGIIDFQVGTMPGNIVIEVFENYSVEPTFVKRFTIIPKE